MSDEIKRASLWLELLRQHDFMTDSFATWFSHKYRTTEKPEDVTEWQYIYSDPHGGTI